MTARLGVVGAGTMGAGIAQRAAMAGLEVRLHDPIPRALSAGLAGARCGLSKGVAAGRWSEAQAVAAKARLDGASGLEELAGAGLVIEAAPEDLSLKREIFARLCQICSPETILATNTSSLSVTAIAAGLPSPHRVVGMHFFNPPPLVPLVEVVAGQETITPVVDATVDVAKRMGCAPVVAADQLGFIGNRCARPFALEGLRLLGDGVADHDTIDRICRIGGGFRMGPFELMDLIGLDVTFDVARSFWEQSFAEPRWRPHPIQARMVAAGRLGRKSGRGYYTYDASGHRPDDPMPRPASGQGTLAIRGGGHLAEALRARAQAAGFEIVGTELPQSRRPVALIDARLRRQDPEAARWLAQASVGDGPGPGRAVPTLILLAGGSLASTAADTQAIGFHCLAPLKAGGLVELTAPSPAAREHGAEAEWVFHSLGLHTEWVADAPGLVLGRIVCQLVNEAAFALSEGVGDAADIDKTMRLGFNYPHGPLEWGALIGFDHVVAVLDGLHRELGEDRYRVAPLLRRWGRSQDIRAGLESPAENAEL